MLFRYCTTDILSFADLCFSSGDPRIVMARLLEEEGRRPEALQVARELLHVMLAAEIDPSYSILARDRFTAIARVLIAIGDDGTASAAFGLRESCQMQCQSCYGWESETAGIFVCRSCLQFHLCPECHRKLEMGALGSTVCSSTHAYYFLPHLDIAERDELDSKLRIGVDSELSLREGWLAKMRIDWNVHSQREVRLLPRLDTKEIRAGEIIFRCLSKWHRLVAQGRGRAGANMTQKAEGVKGFAGP